MLQNTNNHQLLITRNGSIDWEITEQAIREERSQALKEATRLVIDQTWRFTASTAMKTGRGALRALNTYVESIHA